LSHARFFGSGAIAAKASTPGSGTPQDRKAACKNKYSVHEEKYSMHEEK
jgi:hypothetical protein